jgi:hypothetical protein
MTTHRRPLFERWSRDVFRAAGSWAELLEGLGDVRLQEGELVQAFVVGGPEPFPDLLRGRAQRKAGLHEERSTPGLSLYSYTRRFGKDGQNRLHGEFVVAPTVADHVYLVLCVDTPDFYRNGLTPLVASLYPRAARALVSQRELYGLLRGLQRAVVPAHLRILEFSARRRLQVLARKRFESVRDWTDIDIDSAFREASERNVWFRSVSFDVAAGEGESSPLVGVRGRVSKYGYFAANRSFQLVDDLLGKQLVRIAADRLRLLSNRERRSTPNHGLLPVEIVYSQNVFRAQDEIGRLLESLRRMPKSTCTVLHANPYMHVMMVDSRDFSAADVWVLSQDRVLVVPQLKASFAALRRIVNHIFEQFGEGNLAEAANG